MTTPEAAALGFRSPHRGHSLCSRPLDSLEPWQMALCRSCFCCIWSESLAESLRNPARSSLPEKRKTPRIRHESGGFGERWDQTS
jgi:hypothetical protein